MEQLVYQETLSTFINHCLVSKNIAEKVTEGMFKAGYPKVMPNWVLSWENSLPEIAKALKDSSIEMDVDVAVEYRLKHSMERLDFLIYGTDLSGHKNMVIIELKQWSQVASSGSHNRVYTMVSRGHFEDHFHPSYQALNYANQLKQLNEYVQTEKMNIKACSYCHNMDNGYRVIMDDVSLFPFVPNSPSFLEGDAEKLKKFVSKYVSKKCHNIIYEINKSKQIPSDDFASLIRGALDGNEMYSLDSSQQLALTTIVDTVRKAVYYNQKKTIIIKGGAGTGKSIIAVNAMGQLNSPKKKSERITTYYLTVNGTPKKVLFNGLKEGKAFSGAELSQLFKGPKTFVDNRSNDVPCVLVDEAHRVFDWKYGYGIPSGKHLLEEIINTARVAVFFIDDNQAVTSSDFATIESIKEAAYKCHSELIMGPELELMGQYRVQGGANYIAFIKYFLGITDDPVNYTKTNSYDFLVFDDPNEMFNEIKRLDNERRKEKALKKGRFEFDVDDIFGGCRVVAGYTYEWVSDHKRRDDGRADVIIKDKNFAKKWNLESGSGPTEYSWATDPESVNEIGCIHTAQGIDLDYCGVIIGKDITYRDGKICFHKEAHASTDKAGIKTESDSRAKELIQNTYYVLLTRGIRGTFVFCEDPELNSYLKRLSSSTIG